LQIISEDSDINLQEKNKSAFFWQAK